MNIASARPTVKVYKPFDNLLIMINDYICQNINNIIYILVTYLMIIYHPHLSYITGRSTLYNVDDSKNTVESILKKSAFYDHTTWCSYFYVTSYIRALLYNEREVCAMSAPAQHELRSHLIWIKDVLHTSNAQYFPIDHRYFSKLITTIIMSPNICVKR